MGQSVGQSRSAAELADAILEVIERGGRHASVEVVELCAAAKREVGTAGNDSSKAATGRRNVGS